MLIRFSFSNFRCFRLEQELSLVASPPKNRAKLINLDESQVQLHRVAAVFGANATGKSSVLDALEFVSSAVLESHRRWEPLGTIPLPTHELEKNGPSSFEVMFSADGTLYEYHIRLDRNRVLEERLDASRGRRHLLFERVSDREEPFVFGKQLKGENKTIARLTRENSLFLSAAAANNHSMLGPVFAWFGKHLLFAGNDDRVGRLRYTLDQIENGDPEAFLEVLREADFGIADLRFSQDSLTLESPLGERRKVSLDFKKLEFLHRLGKRDFWLPLEDESEGTQAWLALAGPLLHCLKLGSALCVDELDASLHPLLVRGVLDLFQDPSRNPLNAQLIFNSHDVSLLGDIPDESPLDRDQVWITERVEGGDRQLTPLSDFHVRPKENLGRGYLLGRYGGIPLLDQVGA